MHMPGLGAITVGWFGLAAMASKSADHC